VSDKDLIVEGIRAWTASGPGWENQGMTIITRDRITGDWGTRTVYRKDMTLAQHDAFRVGLLAQDMCSAYFADDTEIWNREEQP